MKIHPKTSGAAVGAALGLMIVSVLGSFHGVHLTDEANAAIPGFLASVGAWLVPSDDGSVPLPSPVVVPVAEPSAPVAAPAVPPPAA